MSAITTTINETETDGALTAEMMKVIRKAARDASYDTEYYLSVVTQRAEPTERPVESGRLTSFTAGETKSWVRLAATHRLPEGSDPASFEIVTNFPATHRLESYGDYAAPTRQWEKPSAYRLYAGRRQYKFSEGNTLQSLANVGRVGDTIQLQWLLGFTNGNMTPTGLVQDVCKIALYRGGNFVAVFPLDDVIVPEFQQFTRMLSYKYKSEIPEGV